MRNRASMRSRSRALRLPLIAGVVGIAAVAVIAPPALAATPSPGAAAPGAVKKAIVASHLPMGPAPAGFASWSQVYAMQNRLATAATRILAAGGAGNPSVVLAPRSRELFIYWHGRVPSPVRAVAAKTGVHVVFRPTAYTFSRLVARAKAMAGVSGVVMAAPRPDGSALNVTVSPGMNSAARQAMAQAAGGVSLSVKTGPRTHALFGRQADNAPFWGGDRYFSPVGSCTSGFALSVAGATNVFGISAGHCGQNGDSITVPGQTGSVGTIEAKIQCRDNMVIEYPSGVEPHIYTGPFNSSTNATVAGAAPDFVGEFVETGGASSGEHPDVPVLAVDLFAGVNGIPCTTVGPLDEAGLSGNQCVSAPGDSGGPIFTYQNFPSSVIAHGIVTSGFANASCPGVSPTGSNTVFYTPLLRPSGDPQVGSLQNYGAGILTF